MSPKKMPTNAFYFFMLDYKKKQEARGQTFPGGLKDVSIACGDEWKRMTPQQKGPYESRAKDAKIKNGTSSIKYTSQGIPISLIEKEAKRRQDFEDNMNDYIKMTVDISGGRESLIKKKFYFIHVNWFCRKLLPNGEGDFYPAEFGVVEFSLKNGVEQYYHEIIDIDLPMGYAAEAMTHAEETHKIGRNPAEGARDFNVMYQKLRNLMVSETIGNELPPLYTTRGVMEIVPGLLKRMAEAAGHSVDIFKIYSLEILFFHIRNAAAANSNTEGFPVMTIADRQLEMDVFDTTSGIACEYHCNLDGASIHCSLSVVIRWAYTICDFCCEDLSIERKPGHHCGINMDVDSINSLRDNAQREPIDSYGENSYSIASMTGVTQEYRRKTSERTYREEQERRANSKPLLIIDHSKLQNSNVQAAPTYATVGSSSGSAPINLQRPLRKPHTKSYAMIGTKPEDIPSMDDVNFPAIGGRGAVMRRNIIKQFPPLGRGRGFPTNE